MRLDEREFRAMNNPLRRLAQRWVELPVFTRLGLRVRDRDVLEIGCGSGYAAVLLMPRGPKSYLGIDLMPEMIELAEARGLPGAEFLVMDAADMGRLAGASKDVVVIFDMLHHVCRWREAVAECHRVLRTGGAMFLEEPSGAAVRLWDKVFSWGHPEESLFSWRDIEDHLRDVGFSVRSWVWLGPFRSYAVQKE